MTALQTWRLLPYHLGSSSVHFALSDALARQARRPTVWWHETERPSLIIGPGKISEKLLAQASTNDILVVSRQSGGAAIYARPGVLGLDISLPIAHPLVLSDVVESYRWLGQVWQQTLESLGIDSHLVSVAEARSAARVEDRALEEALKAACFGTLSPYELLADGRKIVGLAQVRRSRVILLQSATHLSFDAVTLARLLAPQDMPRLTHSLRGRVVGLNELSPRRLSTTEVKEAFASSISKHLAVELKEGHWAPAELRQARRYLDTVDSSESIAELNQLVEAREIPRATA